MPPLFSPQSGPPRSGVLVCALAYPPAAGSVAFLSINELHPDFFLLVITPLNSLFFHILFFLSVLFVYHSSFFMSLFATE